MSNKRVQALANKYHIKYAGIFDWFKREKKTPESRQPTAEETSLITDIMASQKARRDLGLDTTGRGTGIPDSHRDEYEELLNFYKENPWALHDTDGSRSDRPKNYDDKLNFYKDKVVDPRDSTINDLYRLAHKDPDAWRIFGKYFEGWSVNAIARLYDELEKHQIEWEEERNRQREEKKTEWTLYDAERIGNNHPKDYDQRLNYYKEKIKRDPKGNIVSDLFRLSLTHSDAWRDFGKYFEGWSLSAIDRLYGELKEYERSIEKENNIKNIQQYQRALQELENQS